MSVNGRDVIRDLMEAQPADPLEPLMTVDEVAAYLRVPKGTLYQWSHRRIGPMHYTVGKHLRWPCTQSALPGRVPVQVVGFLCGSAG